MIFTFILKKIVAMMAACAQLRKFNLLQKKLKKKK